MPIRGNDHESILKMSYYDKMQLKEDPRVLEEELNQFEDEGYH